MKSKYKNRIPSFSSDSSSEMYSTTENRSSSCSSSSDNSNIRQSLEKNFNEIKLSKKDLLKLIKLEKTITTKENTFERERTVKKPKSHNKPVDRKRVFKREEHSPTPSVSERITSEKKKLFITAIEERYSEEEVNQEISKLLKNIQGLVNFRIKKKQGSNTYAFIDFISNENAAEALEQLKKKKIFGSKIAICYSQDNQREKNRLQEKNNGIKKCFECNGKGHFAKECPLKGKLKNYSKVDEMNFSVMKSSENTNFEQEESEEEFVELESNIFKFESEKSSTIKRVVREKSGLNRLPHL